MAPHAQVGDDGGCPVRFAAPAMKSQRACRPPSAARWQPAFSGSQYRCSSWMVGKPRGAGFSEKANAVAPLAAHRSSSWAAAKGSQSGIEWVGIARPAPRRTTPRASSRCTPVAADEAEGVVLGLEEQLTENRVTDGKHKEARIPARSISSRRALIVTPGPHAR